MDFQLCNSITEEEALKLNDEFISQEKKDGVRCIALIENNKVILVSRRGNIITNKFPEIVIELEKLDNCILDSEICSYDDKFNSLQKRVLLKHQSIINQRVKEIPCVMWVFDILKNQSIVLTQKPLKERIQELYLFFNNRELNNVKVLPFENIKESLAKAHERNGEGVVIKSLNGLYSGKRTNEFLKCKFFKETTITITGFEVNNAGIRATDNNENCVQISGNQSNEVKQLLQTNGEVKINVQYLEKTKLNKLRFISYRGLAK